MPYNTGDFTQQGVAGYVNGGLLLNNKRDVTARISTDEESAGIDSVDIKIKDRLNDIEYHITGENLSEGENVIGGGGGTSDFTTVNLTIQNTLSRTVYCNIPETDEVNNQLVVTQEYPTNSTNVVKVVLYKGKALVYVGEYIREMSGGIEYTDIESTYLVTDNASIVVGNPQH